MKIKTIYSMSLFFIFLSSSFIGITSADEAPIEYQGCGSHVVFVEQANITMEKFYVNVTVDLPSVHEEYIYHLRNDVNRTINQTVIVPIIFELYRSKYYHFDSEGDVKIWMNEKEIDYYSIETVSLDQEDLMTDMGSYNGVAFNLSFNPFETIITRVEIRTYHDEYTAEFKYFYSSKTARYWNGTVTFSSFRFKFIGNVDWIDFYVPNGTIDNNTIHSEMHNWDANAEYRITVNLHYDYNDIFPTIQIIVVLAFLGIIVIVIILIRKENERKKKSKSQDEQESNYKEEKWEENDNSEKNNY